MTESDPRKDAERRLLGEADFVYNRNAWEYTYSDFGTLIDEIDTDIGTKGEILELGRLKALPSAAAVNLPVTYNEEGDPEDWEVQLFETAEAARTAYAAAMLPHGAKPPATMQDAGPYKLGDG